ncbi:hypothetical protein LTR70_002369 [Exophiala xenobiotica]|uniref:Uncharacterized protein n=1 Tax=Lithohypha guttulata TaxID=1690604 RepID=A0ABR0KL38_9EURO|nr:hypothetical protein LTR24_001366 [Lithohypha guttulata]KAK5325398.1 hypothetical protein LTR70_002369 [Exophiala xenobiotica]
MVVTIVDLPALEQVTDPYKDVARTGNCSHYASRAWSMDFPGSACTNGKARTMAPNDEVRSTNRRASRKRFDEVGFVIADNPVLLHPAPEKGKIRKAAPLPKAEDIEDRSGRVVVAVTDRTEYVMGHHKFYVLIYFFPEYLHDVDHKATVKTRDTNISNSVRTAAARVKTAEPAEKIDVVEKKEIIRTLSNSLSVTPLENFNNLLGCAGSFFEQTGSPEFLHFIRNTLKKTAPIIKSISPEAFEADRKFFDANKDFNKDDAIALLSGLRSRYESFPNLDTQLVTLVRQNMRAHHQLARLPRESLATFLECTHHRVALDLEPGELHLRLEQLLGDTLIASRQRPSRASRR